MPSQGRRLSDDPEGSETTQQLVISDLRYVVDRLAGFYSPDETRLWLYARHPLLDGDRAIDAIYDGGADLVLAVIDSLADATFP